MDKIQMPMGARKITPDEAVELAKTLSDGSINIYTTVKDENNKIVGNIQVFSKNMITDQLDYLTEKIEEKERSLKTCSIKYRKVLKKEIIFLKELYRSFLKCPTYLPILDSEEITEYNEMVELDLCDTLGSIKTYTMNSNGNMKKN